MRPVRLLVFSLFAVFCFSLPVSADHLNDGMVAYKRGDYKTALELLNHLAEQGNANAQNTLGSMYYHGKGVGQDNAIAMKWLRKAAEQGHANAQYGLAVMYDNGHGEPQDYVEALKWYTRAAERGHAEAQYNVGLMLDSGRGAQQDYAEAVKWYKKASGQGHSGAQYNLALMYSFGQGIDQDYIEAYRWALISARRATEEEARDLALTLRDQVAEKMAPAQIAKARKLARKWKPLKEPS